MTYEQFQKQFHIQLNRQQAEAVRSIDGPILLLAVPGSGKTTVLVTRLGYMIYCAEIAPESILTLTYTISAARDMAKRFGSYFGDEVARRIEFRTINGICAKVIQYYGNLIGKAPFSLATENETITRMLSEIFLRTEESYATESDLKGIRSMITYIKNMMLTGDEIRQLDEEADYRVSEIYKAYNDELHARNRMDYDDQMVYAYNILRKSPETLQYFRNLYSYICVDEAQDTSRIQHEIIRLIAGGRDNLFMVGDEDQSIYGFRAAYPEALLSFEKDHPSAKVLLMEENFRSDGKIVEAADRFIQKNILRHEKHMTAARQALTDIQRIAVQNRRAQYDHLVKVAEECRTQTAVLYRNNESVLPLVDRLERQGLPYRLRNAEPTFFTHRTVLDIRSIISYAMNPKDADLFLQIYYKIGTYIKKADAVRICEIAGKENRDVLETAIRYGQLPDRTVQSCRLIRNHMKCLLSERADKAINRIVYSMGYGEYLERMGMSDSKLFILKMIAQNEDSLQRFLMRLDELQAIMQGRQEHSQNITRTAEERAAVRPKSKLLQERHVSQSILRGSEEKGARQPLILSTIHSSKGLEYDTVYLLDVVDGIFPEDAPKSLKAMDKKERAAYEEERRLFYVGVTRAKNNLAVFKLDQKSSFCEELVRKETRAADKTGKISLQAKAKSRSVQAYASGGKDFSQEEYEKYAAGLGEGLIVQHKKLGEGVVVEVQEDRVTLQFSAGQKVFGLKTLYEYDLLVF